MSARTGLWTAEPESVELDWASRPRSVQWDAVKKCLLMIDQRNLPHSHAMVPHQTVEQVYDSIKTMLVRGAPAIGAAGAYGMVLAAYHDQSTIPADFIASLIKSKNYLDESRPTAVNLSWATGRMVELAELLVKSNVALPVIREKLCEEAHALSDEDVRMNKRLGDFGASILPSPKAGQPLNLLHHCNTGCLATVDYGTALGVIYSAFHQRKHELNVWVDETRPRLQGARLTAWELMREGVPMHLIVDNAAGLLMWQGKVDAIVFGADRVAANGDTANKIGTYEKAVLAATNGIPVYACVPTPTIDLTLDNGRLIVIEERGSEEVTHPQDLNGESIAPPNVRVFNPGFDITPASFITAIVTEEGVCYPPFNISLKQAKEKAEARVREQWQQRLKQYLSETA